MSTESQSTLDTYNKLLFYYISNKACFCCCLICIGGLGFSVRKIAISQGIIGVALLPFTLFYFPSVSSEL